MNHNIIVLLWWWWILLLSLFISSSPFFLLLLGNASSSSFDTTTIPTGTMSFKIKYNKVNNHKNKHNNYMHHNNYHHLQSGDDTKTTTIRSIRGSKVIAKSTTRTTLARNIETVKCHSHNNNNVAWIVHSSTKRNKLLRTATSYRRTIKTFMNHNNKIISIRQNNNNNNYNKKLNKMSTILFANLMKPYDNNNDNHNRNEEENLSLTTSSSLTLTTSSLLSNNNNSLLLDIAANITRMNCQCIGIKSIGVDYGTVRTGLAVSIGYNPKPLTTIVKKRSNSTTTIPIKTYNTRSNTNKIHYNSTLIEQEQNEYIIYVCQEIMKYVALEDAKQIIVGLPFHKNGTYAEQTYRTMKFGIKLIQYTIQTYGKDNVNVIFFDERYTSKEAIARNTIINNNNYDMNIYGSLDEQAACIILENYYKDNGIGGYTIQLPEDVINDMLVIYHQRQIDTKLQYEKMNNERNEKLESRLSIRQQREKEEEEFIRSSQSNNNDNDNTNAVNENVKKKKKKKKK